VVCCERRDSEIWFDDSCFAPLPLTDTQQQQWQRRADQSAQRRVTPTQVRGRQTAAAAAAAAAASDRHACQSSLGTALLCAGLAWPGAYVCNACGIFIIVAICGCSRIQQFSQVVGARLP